MSNPVFEELNKIHGLTENQLSLIKYSITEKISWCLNENESRTFDSVVYLHPRLSMGRDFYNQEKWVKKWKKIQYHGDNLFDDATLRYHQDTQIWSFEGLCDNVCVCGKGNTQAEAFANCFSNLQNELCELKLKLKNLELITDRFDV
jgi:hypothetical protein